MPTADSGMNDVLRELGAAVVLVRDDAGRRVPRMYCMACLEPVRREGRVIWNPALEGVATPVIMVCSQSCEEIAIVNAPGVRRWRHMLLPQFLIELQLGAGLTTEHEVNRLIKEVVDERESEGAS